MVPLQGTWGLDICEAAGGRFFLREPLSGRRILAQGAPCGRSRSGRPGVDVPAIFYPLPQPIFGVGGEGEGEGATKCRLGRLPLRSNKH